MPNQQEHKTITFSFDGTGNEPSDAGRFTEDESVSNVLKLHAHSGLVVSAGGEEPRRVQVNDNDVKSKNVRDLPVIHHSVRRRFKEVTDYPPAALRSLPFRLLMPDRSLSDAIHGISALRAS